MNDYQKIGVIGGGAWGTALAQTLAVAGRDVTLWAFENDCATAINESHENTMYLSRVKLHERIGATTDITPVSYTHLTLPTTPYV